MKDTAFQTGADLAQSAAGAVQGAVKSVKDAAYTSKRAIINAIDENGNGEIDIEDIIIKGLKTPGIRIDRGEFLRKELFKNHPKSVVEDAVSFTPTHAGIQVEEIDRIADEVIKRERTFVSGISAALGMPGGAAMVATLPADIIQYYAYMLRAAQELMYLYGFPELFAAGTDYGIDSETMNVLILCLGVMYGVAGAGKAIRAIAEAFAKGVEKKLINTALTKGAIFPVVKSVMRWFGINLNKKMFAGFFKKAIPVAGSVISGGITYLSFKPCCEKLKAVLRETRLSNPDLAEDGDPVIFSSGQVQE